MSASLAIRPACSLAYGIWLSHRRSLMALMLAAPFGAALFLVAPNAIRQGEAMRIASNLAMMGALFLTFILCSFTEADRHERRGGFPARLFTLPISTWLLIGVPIAYGVTMVVVVYTGWVKIALPVVGRESSSGWPALYLAAAMICYHAIVWSLAGYRLARLLALGVGGTIFVVGWTALCDESWLVPLAGRVPLRLLISGMLGAVGGAALAIAYLSVESQRHGGRSPWQGGRRLMERVVDALPRRIQPLDSPARAQFWLEWRRHGALLPLGTFGVLGVIMLPAPVAAPISPGVTAWTLGWILLTPIALGFALGQGFGKSDLWSKEPGLSLFLATRPLRNTEWIGAKMKAAALASVLAWTVVAALVPLWLWAWCDSRLLVNFWHAATRSYSTPVLYVSPVLALGGAMVVTWRLLVGNLFIGLSGRPGLLNLSVCCVFGATVGLPILLALWFQRPELVRPLLTWPAWSPWFLGGLFVAKAIGAYVIAHYARRCGWIDARAVRRYLAAWLGTTGFLLAAVWLVVPLEGWTRWLSALLVLFLVPLVRPAYAPIALARNRWR